MSSIEPNDTGSEVNGTEKNFAQFVIARCDGPVLFQLSEKVLDQMPVLIHFFIVIALLSAIAL